MTRLSYQLDATRISRRQWAVYSSARCVPWAWLPRCADETWGATGKGRVYRAGEPSYFWYIFAIRIVLGPTALILGLIALERL